MNELIKAIKEANIEKLNQLSLTDKGRGLINKESEKTTPLNLAISLNNLEVVNVLMRFPNLDINFHSEYDDPPIHTAIKKLNNLSVFTRLLQNLAIDVNAKNKSNQYPVSELFQFLPQTYNNWSSPLAEEVSFKFLELLKFPQLEINHTFKIHSFNLPLLFYVVQIGPINAEAIITKFFQFPTFKADIENSDGLNVIEFLLYMYLKFHQRMEVIDERIKFILKFSKIQKLIRPKTMEIVKAKSNIFNLPYFYLIFKKYNILPQSKKVSQILDSIEN